MKEGMDLDALERRYTGARFGGLVLENYWKTDLAALEAAFIETQNELPPAARSLVESWLDEVRPQGRSEGFLGCRLRRYLSLGHPCRRGEAPFCRH